MKRLILSMAGVLLAATLPIVAHHSVAAEFDSTKPVTIKGSVTKLEWMNPHAWLYLDVKNEQGQMEKWQFEFGAPNELVRRGWRRTDLKEGQEVTVQGIMARKGGNTASARSIVLADGKRLFNGQAQAGE